MPCSRRWKSALAHGITHFDTASGYGDGASERLVGRFLQGRRAQVHVATKAGIQDENPQSMLESVKRSLERLNTDTIDLYYIHWPRSDMDIRPAMEGSGAGAGAGAGALGGGEQLFGGTDGAGFTGGDDRRTPDPAQPDLARPRA